MTRRGRYIAIAGNMGVGKSSLVDFVCRHFGLKPLFEPNDTNPYLGDFYKEMKKFAFHSQMYFLAQKFRMHRELGNSPETVVQDRTVFEDAEIFATNLYRQGFIAQRDFQVYWNFYQTIVQAIRPPDLLIYLKCSLPSIKKRVAKRGRAIENAVPDGYLRNLNALYERWIRRYKLSELMVYRTDKMDYVEDFIHKEELLKRIGRYL